MNIRTQLARIKREILKKPYIKDPKYPAYWFDTVLRNDKTVQVVQIGSNDGKTGDPLHALLEKNKTWRGLFVEPVPFLYERLKSNYQDTSRFQLENVAINQGESLDFYWVRPEAINEFPDLPFWFDQLGSFDRNHIINQLGEKVAHHITSSALQGITLETLLTKNDIRTIDILHIDTEGYDWKILSQLNISKYKPVFILFETNHLTQAELNESFDFLKEAYHCFQIGIDCLAVSKTVDSRLISKMNRYMKTVESQRLN